MLNMQFEGDKDLTLPPAAVFARLSDARFLVECIPGRESVVRADQQEAVCVQRPGFAFVRGTLELTIKIVEASPETMIRYVQLGKGIGSSSNVETVVMLSPNQTGTHLHWKAEVKEMGGLLKMIPAGLIRGAAQKTIADVWQEVEKRLQA
jgi:carbon monoxide dehydrogenase subunit G